jgi:hypothetical protein
MRARVGAVLLALAAVLVVLALADVALTGVWERRLARDISAGLGMPTEVTLHGRPALLRSVTTGVPRVVVVVTGPGERAATQEVREIHATLFDVRLSPGRVVGWAAPHGRARVEAATADGFLGVGSLDVRLRDVSGRQGEYRLAAVSAAGGGEDGQRLELDLAEVEVRAGTTQRATGSAASGTLRARDPKAALPAAGRRLRVTFADGTADWRPEATTLTAASIDAVAQDLPLPDGEVVVARATAALPRARLERDNDGMVVTSEGGRIVATIDEEAVRALWRFPGEVELLEGRARVSTGGVALDVEVAARAGQVELRPVVPAFLQVLVGAVPPLRFAPNLPDGTSLDQVTVRPGRLIIEGAADRVVLPNP